MSYIERKLRRIRTKNPRAKSCFINGHDVHTINLLYAIPDSEVRTAIQKYDDLCEVIDICAERDIKVHVWVYVRKFQWFKPIPGVTLISDKDTHWFFRRPKGRVVRAFLAEESEVLMNLSNEYNSVLEQLSEYSQSPFRISLTREGTLAKYELMINMMQQSASLVESFNTVMYYIDSIKSK
ncbi:MAG: hypothetical protein J5808_05800 [Paludibacteraceae bacterium]|nr:hypothetical protein [Paludibacteraceae bacterium]